MTRDEALAIAAERKAARHRRTSRIRKLVATLAVAAFVGPFAVIYGNVAAGKDPALANVVTATASTSESTTTESTESTPTESVAPAPVTTQQS